MYLSRFLIAPALLCFLLIAMLPNVAWSAAFTPGNLVIYRIGTGGAATLAATGNPVILDEYTTAGVLVQSLPMPTTASGTNSAFAASGTATSDGLLTRSADGKCLLVPGYGRDPSVTTGNLTSTAGIARVVGKVTAAGQIDTSTALTDAATGGNFRGATSADCSGFWTTGSVGGLRYATLGATTSTSLTPSVTGVRGAALFGGQLYLSTNTGTNTFKGVSTVGTGAPTTGSPAVTRLPGLTDSNSPSVYGFFLEDLDAGVTGVDTLYVADDSTGALGKFSLVSGSWVSNGTIGAAADSYRGLTGVVSGSSVLLYATRKNGELVTLTDASGYNGAFTGTPTVLATAGANIAFRGVALAPELKFSVTPTAGANGSISPTTPQIVYAGAAPIFTVTPDVGYTAVIGGTCGGTLVGNTYTISPIGSDCTVSASFTSLPTFTVTPSAGSGGTIVASTAQTVLSGNTALFTVTPSAGFTATVGGTCGGTLSGNTYTTSAITGNCTVAATFAPILYTVTPSSGANGSISPATPQTINSGATTSFTLTPDAGYAAAVNGTCGGTLTGNSYTSNAISGNCTVVANFTPLPTYAVAATASAHGSIVPVSAQPAVQGTTSTYTVTPAAGYTVAMRGTCGGTLTGNTYVTKPITAACTVTASFAKKLVLFLGNSYTFGRVDPIMSYNAANVTDLTDAMWQANNTGTNADEPHPWGGIPGVFKKLTDQAGLEYDVSISARNAASLRGHFLNSNPGNWDLRGNAANQKWSTVVLQDLSDEPLPAGRSANANLPYFNAYADKFESWIHVGAAVSYTETDLFGGGSAATCASVTGASTATCNTTRIVSTANPNASAATEIYLYQTWARPDVIAPNGSNVNGTTYSASEGLEAMTADFHNSYFGRFSANGNFKGVSPVGDAFLRAVTSGIAMRDPYQPEAGKINLWHTDYFHPSKYGSYLSALVHFANLTGIDPTTLGAGELAAIDLGIASSDAVALQGVAKATVAPAAPTIGVASAGNGQASITFTPPANIGGLAITGYTATSSPGGLSGNCSNSPCTVTGLSNGVAYTFSVSARNSVGTGSASSASNSVTPSAPVPTPNPMPVSIPVNAPPPDAVSAVITGAPAGTRILDNGVLLLPDSGASGASTPVVIAGTAPSNMVIQLPNTTPTSFSVGGQTFTLTPAIGASAVPVQVATRTVTVTDGNGQTRSVVSLQLVQGSATLTGIAGQVLTAFSASNSADCQGNAGYVMPQSTGTVLYVAAASSQSLLLGHLDSGSAIFHAGACAASANTFAATGQDLTVYAGELVSVDKNAQVAGIYARSVSGTSGEAGDNLAATLNSITGYGFDGIVPQLAKTTGRLPVGATLQSRIAELVLGSNAAGLVFQGQNAMGVLSFVSGTQALISAMPVGAVFVQPGRADGYSLLNSGQLQFVANGNVITFNAALRDPARLLSDLRRINPNSSIQVAADGSLRWNVSGRLLALQAAWSADYDTARQGDAAFMPGIASGAQFCHNADGWQQCYYPVVNNFVALQNIIIKADGQGSVSQGRNGLVTINLLGNTYQLLPDWEVIRTPAAHVSEALWLDGGGRFFVNSADGYSQGFTVH